MAEPVNENEQKIEQLMLKCDKQLDYINDLKKELIKKDNQVKEYKNIVENIEKNNGDSFVKDNAYSGGLYREMSETFFKTIEYIVKNNAYIEGKRDGRVSISNMIVKATYFKGLIKEYTTVLSPDKVIKLWCELGMIRFNENKNIPYFTHNHNGKSIRVIRINKDWVKLVKESMIQ